MLACGDASTDGLTTVGQKSCGGLHEVPLIIPSHVRINIHFGGSVSVGSGSVCPPTVCFVIYAHVVPDTAMSTTVLLGRDSWSHSPVQKYRDVSETETVQLSLSRKKFQPKGDQSFTQCVNKAGCVIEGKGNSSVVVRHSCRPPNAKSWLFVSLTNDDGSTALEGA